MSPPETRVVDDRLRNPKVKYFISERPGPPKRARMNPTTLKYYSVNLIVILILDKTFLLGFSIDLLISYHVYFDIVVTLRCESLPYLPDLTLIGMHEVISKGLSLSVKLVQ